MSVSPYDPPRPDEGIARSASSLMAYTALTFVVAVASPLSRWIDPKCDWNLCLATVFLVALLGRVAGWSLHWPAGHIGRHAVAFFVGTMCASVTLIWIQYFYHNDDFVRDFRDGVAAMSLIYGIGIGAVAEFVASVAWTFRPTANPRERSESQ
ncbi:MAG: hypothetical protein KDB27_22135 [Planctomycetales bacterium]|nr:hypothetical protein [Planctomycetales bacterium]